MVLREPPQPQLLLYSHPSDRLHKDVATLEEFIFRIHSDVWIQVCYSHTLVCLSSLWLGKELCQFHLEMGEYWNHHHSIVLFQDVCFHNGECALFFSTSVT